MDVSSQPVQVFRSKGIVVSGIVYMFLCACLVAAGIVLYAIEGRRFGLPLGLVLLVLAVPLGLAGAGRLLARLEVRPTKLRWQWWLSWHELDLREAVEPALIEPGRPASGGEWGGFLGGGVDGVIAWMLFDLFRDVVAADPTSGLKSLAVVRSAGGPVRIHPMGTFSVTGKPSAATRAHDAIDTAIRALRDSGSRRSPAETPPPPPART